jgi:hypothetical protein
MQGSSIASTAGPRRPPVAAVPPRPAAGSGRGSFVRSRARPASPGEFPFSEHSPVTDVEWNAFKYHLRSIPAYAVHACPSQTECPELYRLGTHEPYTVLVLLGGVGSQAACKAAQGIATANGLVYISDAVLCAVGAAAGAEPPHPGGAAARLATRLAALSIKGFSHLDGLRLLLHEPPLESLGPLCMPTAVLACAPLSPSAQAVLEHCLALPQLPDGGSVRILQDLTTPLRAVEVAAALAEEKLRFTIYATPNVSTAS